MLLESPLHFALLSMLVGLRLSSELNIASPLKFRQGDLGLAIGSCIAERV
jgi:hypothetical protein